MKIWQTVRLVTPGLASFLIACEGVGLFTGQAYGQIIPDTTLGAESSVLMPGGIVDLIGGGATRGSALFHSFADFNVNTGQQVYFANPIGIENILSRVTGLNPSQIDGLLGVDGAANLFFINPNGILFGPDAQLDVEGAFLASTSDRFRFTDGSEFRATDPNEAPLVTVNIPLGLQLGPNAPAALVSEADLTVGGDLTLSAGRVTSTGLLSAPNGTVRVEGVSGDVQVQAVEARSAVLSASETLMLEGSQLVTQGDLSLLAEETVRIRDSVETPFLAAAGGDLRVQGNEQVDIYAFHHPQTRIQSGGDIALISDGIISADAHFTGGGDFRVLTVTGDIAPLYSIDDPVITMGGDVPLGNYTGASLLVNAGGNITFGTVSITAVDPAIDPGPAFFLNAGGNITGTGSVSTTLPDGSLEVSFTATGRIDLSNGSILTRSNTGDAGSVTLISNFSASPTDDPAVELANPAIRLTNVGIDAASFASDGRSGDVTIQANSGAIVLEGNRTIFTDTFATDPGVANTQTGGDLLIEGAHVQITDYRLNGTVRNDAQGNGGDITVNALNGGTIDLNNVTVTTEVEGNAIGDAGDILIGMTALGNTNTATITVDDSTITSQNSETNSPSFDPSLVGLPGNITLLANGNIELTNTTVNSASNRSGPGFTTIRLQSNGGAVLLNQTDVNAVNAGDTFAGDIFVDAATTIDITNGSTLSADGNFGRIFLGSSSVSDATPPPNLVRINNSFVTTTNQVGTVAINEPGGDIAIRAQRVAIEAGSGVNASTVGQGDAGSIDITALGDNDPATTDLVVTGSQIQATASIQNMVSTAEGSAGEISLQSAADIEVTNGSLIQASSLSTNSASGAGLVELQATNGTITLSDSTLENTVANGAGGNIDVQAQAIAIENGASVSVSTSGQGDVGSITITALGDNDPTTTDLAVRDSQIQATTSSSQDAVAGNAGTIFLTAQNGGEIALQESSTISSDTSGAGNSGNVQIEANRLLVTSGSAVQARSTGTGAPGSIELIVPQAILIDGIDDVARLSELSTFSGVNAFSSTQAAAAQNPGLITIQGATNGQPTQSITLSNRGRINALTDSADASQVGGDIDITVGFLRVTSGGQIVASSTGAATAGNVSINATEGLELSGSEASLQSLFGTPTIVRAIGDVQLDVNDQNQLQNVLITSGVGSVSVAVLEEFLSRNPSG